MSIATAPSVSVQAEYELLARDRLVRAGRVRARAARLDETLEPLRVAMKRRACELELSGTALHLIAAGQR